MRIAVDIHRKLCPQSNRYYEKKRAEGKKYNQAIRALGRHLCPVIFKMLKNDRPYKIQPESDGDRRHLLYFKFPPGCSTVSLGAICGACVLCGGKPTPAMASVMIPRLLSANR
jgi:hypothetical protein